jgi:probable F420-dependent oxidoreductase
LKVGALVVTPGLGDPQFLRTVGEQTEAAGLDSIWLADHIVIPRQYESPYPYSPDGRLTTPPYPESLTTLSFLAAVTSRIQIGTAVLVLPQRNPILLAKQAATIALLSSGRLRLGVGVGWLREEFEVLGESFETRGARTNEHIEVMQRLWREDTPIFDGKYTSLDGTISIEPRPPGGSIDMVIGGHSPAAARRAGRYGDGFFPMAFDLGQLTEAFRTAADEGERCGRDPALLERIAMGGTDPNRADALAAIGVQHLLVPVVMAAPDEAVLCRKLDEIRAFRDQR